MRIVLLCGLGLLLAGCMSTVITAPVKAVKGAADVAVDTAT